MTIIAWLRRVRWRLQPHEHNWVAAVTGRNMFVIGKTCTLCERTVYTP